MRTYDFAPLYRSTVGFDRLASMLDRAMTVESSTSGYPPYNIEKTGEDAYRISIAAAGFADSDLSIEMRDHELVVKARKGDGDTSEPTYLHRGIAARAFEKRFHLADHVRATGASSENGVLHIDLVRELPEALKPRKIEIGSAGAQVIEAKPSKKKTAKAAA